MQNQKALALQWYKQLRARRLDIRRDKVLRKEIERDLERPTVPEGPRSIQGFGEFSWPIAHWSHGQCLQDLWVAYELGAPEGGFFVEFGVANGFTMSNTIMLERRFGWTGIISEPNPHFHADIERSRTCHFTPKAVHDATGLMLRFECATRPMLSRLSVSEDARGDEIEVVQSFDVETISLDDLLDAYKAPDVVDYISVDTEGTELDILRAFDFGRRHVRALSVEHNYGDRRMAIRALMEGHGYVHRFPEMSRFDDWYLHRDDLPS